ncbi:MAG: metallophosphoesterase family protein [Candidatus Bathyarchaeota archaeon]|nr:metallophosphoesterase family protein [Candidatus Termiticorpusculum sp.]MCL2869018.1 metallophosphoesterase family protein [Candidatus Termiticorpusculum sp.]
MNLQTKNTKKILSFALTLCVLFSMIAVALPNAVATDFGAEALTLQPGSTERDINFNWYSANTADQQLSVVQYAKEFSSSWITVYGSIGVASVDKMWHKVSVTGLDYNTQYKYKVSNDDIAFSVEYRFKTGSESNFQFIAVGDPQLTTGNQDGNSLNTITTTANGWKNTLDIIRTQFPGASFMAGTGDQVDTATDEDQYANYFAPSYMSSLPVAPAVGNHEGTAANFGYHFNVPNQTPNENNYFGNYWYTYNNALFVVLNTAPYPDSATALDLYIPTMDATLKAATEANPDAQWFFVQTHKSPASPASHQTDGDVLVWTPAFMGLMDKYSVDFVLAGHDHVYSRSWFIKNSEKVDGINYSENSVTNPQGTLYFTLSTASGLKYYDFPENAPGNPVWVNSIDGMYYEGTNPITFTGKPWYTNIGIQVKVPQFTVVDVTADSVTFNTYRVDTMTSIDTYTVIKPVFVSATPEASVEKLNGNKNNLAITVTELYSDGSTNVLTQTISIDNNAAATYSVGSYRVYVDTKGNTQIRACYIV